MTKERVLIFGASGMLGSMLFKCFHQYADYELLGTMRTGSSIDSFRPTQRRSIKVVDDIFDSNAIKYLIADFRPSILINCIGVVKQLNDSLNPLVAIPINSLFPHRLDSICAEYDCKLIHFSTDCVFSGHLGNYREESIADARDMYGLSKYMGEVVSSSAITLRTSIIGHELSRHTSLVDWFLRSEGRVNGFRNAVFSGLTTREIYEVINNYILPNKDISGLFHLASDPISKYDLLSEIKLEYNKQIDIIPVDMPAINRSLDAKKFQMISGYSRKPWRIQIKQLREASINFGGYDVCR